REDDPVQGSRRLLTVFALVPVPQSCPASLSRRLAAQWMLPSAKSTASASTMANTFGAQSHGLSARCLRFVALLPGLPVVRSRKTRLPAGGQPLLRRLVSGSGPL